MVVTGFFAQWMFVKFDDFERNSNGMQVVQITMSCETLQSRFISFKY